MVSNDLPARGSRALTGSVFRADFGPFYNILQAGSTSFGGGPGRAATTLYLIQSGIKPLIIERQTFPTFTLANH